MKKKEGVSRLLEIAGEKKGLLWLSGIMSAISALFLLVPFGAVYNILKELLVHASNLSAIDSDYITLWGWYAFGGLIIGMLLMYAGLMMSHIAAFRILYGLKVKLSSHLGGLPLGFLNSTSTGAIKKLMEQNVEKIEHFIAHTIPDLVNVFATIIFMFTIFFSLNGWMALTALVCIIISLGMQFSNFVGKRAKALTKEYFDVQERMSSSAVQYVRGMPVIKVFGQSIQSFRQFNAEIEAYKTFAMKCCNSYQNGIIAFMVILNSIVTFVLPVGLLIMTSDPHNISLAVIYLFFIIMGPGVASPVYKLAFLSSATVEINEGVKRIDDVLNEKKLEETAQPIKPHTYDIEFRNVSFSYEDKHSNAETIALSNVSFVATQGKITALVGPSGAGKSTIANLIPRFWDVTSGEILIGGINIKNIATPDLLEMVSFVFQDTFLFNDTIYANIAAGNPNASRTDLEHAAQAAQCDEFIKNLPNGYDTVVGDKGTFLSGGEAQRICIARAILRNSPILVLDEATAFADPENEYKIRQALQKLIKGKTVIIIAHRLSSITSANQILVFEEGRLVQKGKHNDLLATEGTYQNMWNAYTNTVNWKLNLKTTK
ncbi:MAG: ABC transporter ATP-binding protein/permease [Bacteroidaceae bacterium]|nr:ABC transporter ATP-binding protein/permease [Bacteroidaceae bacterium]